MRSVTHVITRIYNALIERERYFLFNFLDYIWVFMCGVEIYVWRAEDSRN